MITPGSEEVPHFPAGLKREYRACVGPAEEADILHIFDRETAVVAYWHHRLGEEAPELDPDCSAALSSRATPPAGGSPCTSHEVEDAAPPLPGGRPATHCLTHFPSGTMRTPAAR